MCLWLQASFDPPGLTVFMKKYRAVETMLVQSNIFSFCSCFFLFSFHVFVAAGIL